MERSCFFIFMMGFFFGLIYFFDFNIYHLFYLQFVIGLMITDTLTDPNFCFVYIKYGYQCWIVYFSIALTIGMLLRMCYQLKTYFPNITRTNRLIYILIMIWLTTTTTHNIISLNQYNNLSSNTNTNTNIGTLIDIDVDIDMDIDVDINSNQKYLPEQVYIQNIQTSKTIWAFLVISQVSLQSILVFFYALLQLYSYLSFWRVLYAVRKKGQGKDVRSMEQAEAKIYGKLGCCGWSIRVMVAYGVLRYFYLFLLLPILNSDTPQKDLLSNFSTIVGSIDPQLLLFPAILICFIISISSFKQTIQTIQRLNLQNIIRMLPISFSLRAFQLIIFFNEPKWYTYKQQKCNINTDQHIPFDITTVAIIFSTCLNFWIVHLLLNGQGIQYDEQFYDGGQSSYGSGSGLITHQDEVDQ